MDPSGFGERITENGSVFVTRFAVFSVFTRRTIGIDVGFYRHRHRQPEYDGGEVELESAQ